MADSKSTRSSTCGACGAELEAVSKYGAQRYCDKTCRLRALFDRRKAERRARGLRDPRASSQAQRHRRLGLGSVFEPRVCVGCAQSFQPNKLDRKYCSRACAFADPEWKRAAKDAKASVASARFEAIATERAARRALCVMCGASFKPSSSSSRACSDDCRVLMARRDGIEHYKKTRRRTPGVCVCAECGLVFEPEYNNKHRFYCSVSCCRIRSQRISKGVRRARLRSVGVEAIDPIAVFQRDGWCCQLCGVKTPRSMRGTHKASAPELDHIVPISKGGAHEWANVQCACRACNQKKGDKVMGQFRLA